MHIHSTSFRQNLSSYIILLCSLFLLFTLDACSTVGSASSSNLSTAKTPTPNVHLTTYQAKTFSIGYPNTWTTTDSNYFPLTPGAEQIEFDEELTGVSIQTLPNTTNLSTTTFLSTIINSITSATFIETKPASLPGTVQVGKETWMQQGFTGNRGSESVKLPEKVICLANYHNQNKRLYSICLETPTGNLGVDPAIGRKFQAMLNSFQFK